MKKRLGIYLAVALLAVLVIPVSASQAKIVPTINILSVVQNESVTIQTAYFPAYDTFNVTMGLSGTQGIGGILVSRLTTGAGGSIVAKFRIPSELYGQQIISIRLESPTSGYYSYNWFYNSTATVGSISYPSYYYLYYPSALTPTWRGIQEGMPRFDIVKVYKGDKIDVRLINYPANREYVVYMKDGRSNYTTWYDVTVFNSAAGGIFDATFKIPEDLKYRPLIAVKIYDRSRKIFTVNLFYNE